MTTDPEARWQRVGDTPVLQEEREPHRTSGPKVPRSARLTDTEVYVINERTGEWREMPRWYATDFTSNHPDWEWFQESRHARLLRAEGDVAATPSSPKPSSPSAPSLDLDGRYDDDALVWPTRTAMEVTLARLPIWVPAGTQLRGHDDWCTVGSLFGEWVEVREPFGPLTMRDAALASHLQRSFLNDGCPESNEVVTSLGKAAQLSGQASKGGWQREQARKSFERLHATEVRSVVGVDDPEVREWRILTGPGTVGSDGMVRVQLGPELAEQLRKDLCTYLDRQVLHDLLALDELAARLWVFLESETFPRTWQYLLYSNLPGRPEKQRPVPAIVDILRVAHQRRRSNVRERIARAAKNIERIDSRYQLDIEPASRRGKTPQGMWNLKVRKTKAHEPQQEARRSGQQEA